MLFDSVGVACGTFDKLYGFSIKISGLKILILLGFKLNFINSKIENSVSIFGILKYFFAKISLLFFLSTCSIRNSYIINRNSETSVRGKIDKTFTNFNTLVKIFI